MQGNRRALEHSHYSQTLSSRIAVHVGPGDGADSKARRGDGYGVSPGELERSPPRMKTRSDEVWQLLQTTEGARATIAVAQAASVPQSAAQMKPTAPVSSDAGESYLSAVLFVVSLLSALTFQSPAHFRTARS